jgi:2-(1,2-epoxy-1,2-dihydrophenyl)acetyl-CoA isomerase
MDQEHLMYVKDSGIATLTLDRPKKMNAFTPSMHRGMSEIIKDAANDNDVKVLVITGTGRAFCVGADVKALEEGFGSSTEDLAGAATELLSVALVRMRKPVIAAINGIAAGGGLDAACACDIRIASDRARFSSLFVRRGLVPTMGGTYFLPRLIGTDRACEMIWTGDIIDANEAERIGLVTRVVPHEELSSAVEELALKLASGPPLAIAGAKRLVYRGLSQDLDFALDDIMREYAALSQTRDHREALRAYLEKREPQFEGI